MTQAARHRRPGLGRRIAGGIATTWRLLGFEQRLAAVGSLLLIVSTFGPFSFIEAAIVLVGLSVLLLLRRRAQGRDFHLPFGDGTIVATAGAWSAVLILLRLFSRPLGQGLLALVCAAVLVVAGLLERARQPADDVPVARGERRRRPGAAETADDEVEWETPPSSPKRRWERAKPPIPRRRAREAPPFDIDAPDWTPSAADPAGIGPFGRQVRPRERGPAPAREDQPGAAEAVDPSPKPDTAPAGSDPAPRDEPPPRRRVPPASPIARATTPPPADDPDYPNSE